MSKLAIAFFTFLVIIGTLTLRLLESGLTTFQRSLPLLLLFTGLVGLIAVSLGLRFLGSSRTNNALTNGLIALISLAISGLIGETFLRYIYRDVTTTGENSGYFDQRWFDQTDLNSLGYREEEFSLQKPDGVYRIAVIGDSITFGQGVGPKNRFSDLLETKLNALDLDTTYEVLNFGIPGHETVNEVQTLKEDVLPADPDFILLQWYTNDPEGHDKSGRPKPRVFIPVEIRTASVAMNLLHDQLNRIQREHGSLGSYEDYMWERFGDPESEDSIKAQAALDEFISLAATNEIPMGIVLYIDNDNSLSYLADRVLNSCLENDLVCHHLGDMFEPYKDDPTKLWASPFDAHPGILGHQLIAEEIFTIYEQEWREP